ncbi:MAG: T9SS type A sorting domain-containing protein [Candidatus Syntrophosphaera sp.]
MPKILCLTMAILFGSLQALSAQAPNQVQISGLDFKMNLHANQRLADYVYEPLYFTVSSQIYPDSLVIVYTHPQLDLTINISPTSKYYASAYLFNIRADFKQEIYMRELYLTMDSQDDPINACLTGVEAIQTKDSSSNRYIMPYMDRAAEYHWQDNDFWIVASGYQDCDGVEGLAGNQIHLYDHRVHFFRVLHHSAQSTNMLRDTMYKTPGSTHHWSFLLFTQKPILLDINRWLGDKRAAFCMSNDADDETLERLQAVFEGSSNPASPKYYTKGFFAREIPINSTIFGSNQPTLGPMWNLIKDHGNTIGYHTYDDSADPPGANAQALLQDLLEYDIRMWIDHSVLRNPEDISHNGLYPDSLAYVADIIEQSGIDYIWPADTPYTNPFNSFDEPWRLPHIVYEAKVFSRPIWFFGRTRTETWEYTNGYNPVSMKYLITPANLDQLLADRGLHHSYTHLCCNQGTVSQSFWQISPTGDYEIRDEVDEMLQMLDFYRQHRGLWIATPEDIYDRMLAIEQVQVASVQKIEGSDNYRVDLVNSSDLDIEGLCLDFKGLKINIPLFPTGETRYLYLKDDQSGASLPPANFQLIQSDGILRLKSISGAPMQPMRVDIYNLRGQKVRSQVFTVSQEQYEISFDGRASGIYFARVSPENGSPVLMRFTVVK